VSIKHDRKCWHCKTLFTTFNDTLPGCKCPQCGCEDTRRVKPSEALLQTAECRVTQLEAENERLRSIIDTLTAKAPATASLAVFLCSRCRESVDTIYEVGSGAKVEHVCVKCVDAGGDDDE